MGDIFGPEDEGGALFTPAPRLPAFERLEAALGLLCTEGLAESIETYPPTLELTLRGKRMLRGEIPTPSPEGGA